MAMVRMIADTFMARGVDEGIWGTALGLLISAVIIHWFARNGDRYTSD